MAQLDDGQGSITEAQQLPAVFINRFFLSVGPILTRISFGETIDGTDVTFRTAIIMPTSDAKELADLIYGLAAKNSRETAAEGE